MQLSFADLWTSCLPPSSTSELEPSSSEKTLARCIIQPYFHSPSYFPSFHTFWSVRWSTSYSSISLLDCPPILVEPHTSSVSWYRIMLPATSFLFLTSLSLIFSLFTAMTLVSELFSVTFGEAISAISPSVYIASLATPFFIAIFNLFCGVTIPKNVIPGVWRTWLY